MSLQSILYGNELSGPTQSGEVLKTTDGSATGVGGLFGNDGYLSNDNMSEASAGFSIGSGLSKFALANSEQKNAEMNERILQDAQIGDIKHRGLMSRIANDALFRDALHKKRAKVQGGAGTLADILESARTLSK